jgi:nitrogen fixation NifU-like protein
MSDELTELYQEMILDHGKHPRNLRHPDDANREAKGNNPLCGDRLTVYLRIDDGTIADAAFEGRGCAISTASASLMTEVVKGKTEAEAHNLFARFRGMCTGHEHGEEDDEDMDRLRALAGVQQFPMRVKCATLAWHTLEKAIEGGGKATTE